MPKERIAVTSIGKPRIANITNAIINSCNAIGVPRMIVTYTLQTAFGTIAHLLVLGCILTMATSVPRNRPTAAAPTDIMTVESKPSPNSRR